MTITDAKWIDSDKRSIKAVVDGVVLFIPVDPKNRHYAEIIRQNIQIAE